VQVVVTGSHGLIGSEVVAALEGRGHRPIRLVRSAPGRGEDGIYWNPATGAIDAPSLEGIDAAVHLAGKNVGRPWWTETHKAQVMDSRVRGTRLLSETLAGLNRPPAVLVSASAVGYYGDRGDEVVTESSPPGTGVLPDICREWEASIEPASRAGIRVAVTRMAIVLGGKGGAIAPLVLIFRLGLGGPIANGDQFWPWIAVDDVAGAIIYIIEGDASGPINFAAPHLVRNAEFVRTLAKVLRRPAIIPAPAFAIKLAVGPEMAEEMLLLSQRIEPRKLLATGYDFRYPELEGALRHVLGKDD
jgi:uncharacterized protein